jgi:hypothetical protein
LIRKTENWKLLRGVIKTNWIYFQKDYRLGALETLREVQSTLGIAKAKLMEVASVI